MTLNLHGFLKKTVTKKILIYVYSLISAVTLTGYQSAANAATTVTVQNGRGLVGVFGNYTSSLTGSTLAYGAIGGSKGDPFPYIGMNFWYNGTVMTCYNSMLMNIDGVYGIKLQGTSDLMIVPEVIYTDNRSWTSPSAGSDIVTASFNGYGSATNGQLGTATDCIWQPKQSTPIPYTTSNLIYHNAVITGRLLIYGTGNQRSGTYTLQDNITMMLRDWNVVKEVTWANKGSYIVNVSDLGCTLTTPTVIDFGPQPANATNGQLLTTKSDSNLTVNCQQNTNPMSATLSVSAGINPIYFSGDSYQVNLLDGENKPGAYVTMSLNINGTPTNIPFNRTPVDIGSISSSNSDASFSYPITYSLYSRGTGSTGKIKGSAELSVILR